MKLGPKDPPPPVLFLPEAAYDLLTHLTNTYNPSLDGFY